MNPAEYNMLWLGQFAPDRMILDENSMLSVGMSVLEDPMQQHHSMDISPMMGVVSEFSASTASGPIAITPDIYPTISSHGLDPQHQTMLDQYNIMIEQDPEDDDQLIKDEDDELMQQQQQLQNGGCIIVNDMPNDDDSMHHYDQLQPEPDHESVQICENSSGAGGVDYQTQFDTDTDNSVSQHTYMAPKALQPINKKIKPVKRPGLVLKTPIAYQPCLDPSVIPIQRDGMAVCERCGAIGVKHSFYTKERRFCSMACARNELERLSYAHTNQQQQQQQQQPQNQTMHHGEQQSSAEYNNQHPKNSYRFKMTPQPNEGIEGVMFKDILPQDDIPQINQRLPSPCPQDDKILSVRRKPSEYYNSYDWIHQLNHPNFFAAEVTCFRHAPGREMWNHIGPGMIVEVENTDCDNQGIVGQTPHSFWVASVLRICGYKALMRYEGFGECSSHDFWVNLCMSEVHPVGWCATRGKPLIPPRSVENKFSDWKEFLTSHLSGAFTLPSTFYNKISDSFRSRFRVGLQLEVVDKNRISQVKLATVHKIVGKRLFVKYFDAPPDDNGFWCHEDSPLIHPVGWASTVGHNLAAPLNYIERMAGGPDQIIEATEDDSIIELFKMNFTFEEYYLEGKTSGFKERMKLEAVDPLNLSSICVATVMQVLKFGYMMIRIDSYEPDATGADWFCYHERSPCIFPPGFCNENQIVLTPPRNYENGTFRWNQYLRDTNSVPADKSLFHRELPAVNFQVGMKVECADLMDPRLVCVATIAKVVGRLLKVHFDGWEEEYDQWLDCESPDMYPVGWCVMVGHKLEGPRVLPKAPVPPKILHKTTKQRKRKKTKTKLDNGKSMNAIVQTRHSTVKKDREIFDQQRHTNEIKMIHSRSGQNTLVKQEPKHDMSEDDEEEDDIEYEEDEYSYTASGHSTPLPISPEPTLTTSSIKNPTVLLAEQPLLSVRSTSQKLDQPSATSEQLIPRLCDSNDAVGSVQPGSWTVSDVTQFLRINECSAHGDAFARHEVDGKQLLQLTKDEIITMLDMKVGPSLKIFDLIQQLKCKINPQQSRIQKANSNKKYL